jgi:hypothetical protein
MMRAAKRVKFETNGNGDKLEPLAHNSGAIFTISRRAAGPAAVFNMRVRNSDMSLKERSN